MLKTNIPDWKFPQRKKYTVLFKLIPNLVLFQFILCYYWPIYVGFQLTFFKYIHPVIAARTY